MSVSRRSFFKAFAAATAGAALLELDPEQLLWKPGEKTFFIPDTPKVYRPNADATVFERTLAPFDTYDSIASDFYGKPRHPELYTPNRYRMSISGIGMAPSMMDFDSDWKLQRAVDLSDRARSMSDTEQADLVKQVLGRRRG